MSKVKVKVGWVFTKEGSKKEIGFAEAGEYENAEVAVEKWGRDYPEHFDVYFRDIAGKLHSCGADSIPLDFYPKVVTLAIDVLESHSQDGCSGDLSVVNAEKLRLLQVEVFRMTGFEAGEYLDEEVTQATGV